MKTVILILIPTDVRAALIFRFLEFSFEVLKFYRQFLCFFIFSYFILFVFCLNFIVLYTFMLQIMTCSTKTQLLMNVFLFYLSFLFFLVGMGHFCSALAMLFMHASLVWACYSLSIACKNLPILHFDYFVELFIMCWFVHSCCYVSINGTEEDPKSETSNVSMFLFYFTLVGVLARMPFD